MFNFVLKLIDSLIWPLVILIVIWLAFFLNLNYNLDLNQFGLRPHTTTGLFGIFSMAFLHGDAEHLLSNTVPLLLSLGFVFLYFEDHKWKIIITITVLSGIILWFIGEPNSNHIGASGVVYGLIAFLITHAFFTKNKETLAASFVLIFLYGGLIYGLFPDYGMLVGKNISWEGHLSGAIVGVLLALYYRKLGPQRETFFEDEEDDDDDDNWQYFPPEDDFTVNYHYRDGNNADS